MVTPISFIPIEHAIGLIPKELVPGKLTDLSNVAHEFETFSSLSSGSVLIGAFANAAKSFGYLARAGATREVQRFYNIYSNIREYIRLLENGIEVELVDDYVENLTLELAPFGLGEELAKIQNREKSTALNKLKAINTLIKSNISKVQRAGTPSNLSPTVNPNLRMRISIDGKTQVFDRMVTKDVRDKYTITQILDTLTNSAVDNLKLGYLGQARINTNTGSAVVGMVSLGIPLDIAVQVLYQPILAPLAQNRVRNTADWLDKIKYNEKYKKKLLTLGTISDVELKKALSDSKLQNMSLEEMETVLSEEDFNIQLKAFDLFTKAYKIGEDMRNLAVFLDLVRSHDVFVEDILQLEDNLINKIGTPVEIDGELILATHPDFSFPIPNLFESAPHVKEAYLTHRYMIELIKSNFKVHSPQLIEFSEEVKALMPKMSKMNELGEYDQTQAQLAKIRRSLSFYVLSGLIANNVKSNPRTIKIGKDKNPMTLSKLRSFSNDVAEKLWRVKQLARGNDIDNLFLRSISVKKDSNLVSSISFKSGVNLDSATLQELALGFRQLNKFQFGNDNTPSINLNVIPTEITQFQWDLLSYAVLNYGLQYSTSNFSSFISPELLAVLDKDYNSELDRVMDDSEYRTKIAPHFLLSHIMQNASSLTYVPSENVVPGIPSSPERSAVRPGKEKDIYFDLKVKKKLIILSMNLKDQNL